MRDGLVGLEVLESLHARVQHLTRQKHKHQLTPDLASACANPGSACERRVLGFESNEGPTCWALLGEAAICTEYHPPSYRSYGCHLNTSDTPDLKLSHDHKARGVLVQCGAGCVRKEGYEVVRVAPEVGVVGELLGLADVGEEAAVHDLLDQQQGHEGEARVAAALAGRLVRLEAQNTLSHQTVR